MCTFCSDLGVAFATPYTKNRRGHKIKFFLKLYRCAIVAYTNSGRRLHRGVCEQTAKSGQSTQFESCKCSSYVSNTACKRLEEQTGPKCGWWEAEPNVDRVADGVSNRVDRLKCLGNAVVPQQFYPIFDAISKIQGGVCND